MQPWPARRRLGERRARRLPRANWAGSRTYAVVRRVSMLPNRGSSAALARPFRSRRRAGDPGAGMKPLWIPRAMRVPPRLDPALPVQPARPRYALLINPFYPKDPHASFGKHVLTPSLALTSIAAATPRDWDVFYWDENLLQGPPPHEPFPQVVGMTVHLTFARRAGCRATPPTADLQT